jgi:hypothetical protein
MDALKHSAKAELLYPLRLYRRVLVEYSTIVVMSVCVCMDMQAAFSDFRGQKRGVGARQRGKVEEGDWV